MADINRINELVGEKDFKSAYTLTEEALTEEPENVELIKLAGLIEVNLEIWKKAQMHFETVIKYNDSDATAWFYLASCYDHLGDFISAKNAYIKVIDLRSEYKDAYKSLCIVLLKLNQPSEAISFAARAKIVDSEDYIYDFVIGTAYLKVKEFEKSIEPYKRALEKSPSNVGIYNSLGTAYMATNSPDEAIKCYTKALEIEPENPMSYYNLGSAYQIQQNHKTACEYLKKAVEIDEEDESFKVAYAMSLVKSEQYKTAIDVYKKLLTHHPEKENYKYNLVTCYEAVGEIQTAITMLEGMVFLNQKFIPPAQKLATLYIKTNQLSKAKEIYD